MTWLRRQDNAFDLSRERARLAAAQRTKVEYEVQKLRRELVDAASVVAFFRSAARRTRDAVLAVANRLAPMVAAEQNADRVHQTIVEELQSALANLADSKVELAVADKAEFEQREEAEDG